MAGTVAARRQTLSALLLVLPMLVFLGATFLAPIAGMLYRSVANAEVRQVLPLTAARLVRWPGGGVPPAEVAAALIAELPQTVADRTLGLVAQRLNHDVSGLRSLVLRTARALPPPATAGEDPLAVLLAIDPRWGDPATWAAFKRASHRWTDLFLLNAVDLDRDENGRVAAMPASEAVFRDVLIRTVGISATVTLACLVLGFPLAKLLTEVSSRCRNLLMIGVLLPFWTSLLVRTSAWIVLLQNEGIINGALLAMDLIAAPLPMMFNRFGVVVAMTHVLLPFMILPLYSVLKAIPAAGLRAAASLGAPPWLVFLRVYLPQAVPGIAAGGLLVFILALGYYITPALVGGADDQMLSSFIAFYTNRTVNWSLAAALAALLLAATALLYAVYGRLAGNRCIGLG